MRRNLSCTGRTQTLSSTTIRAIANSPTRSKETPKEFDLVPQKISNGKLIRNLSDSEFEDLASKGLLTPDERSAWYIGKSHELLKKADVEVYAPKAGVSEDDMVKLLKEHLEDPKAGKSGANLTLAIVPLLRAIHAKTLALFVVGGEMGLYPGLILPWGEIAIELLCQNS